jgi:predicted RNase H-like HicB family nuclease
MAFLVNCPNCGDRNVYEFRFGGCVSQGETREQAIVNVRDAIRQCLEVRADRGLPLTVATYEVEIPV